MGETLDGAPARHLQMLLARAQNPFDVSDEVLLRLADAVLCQTDVHAGCHRDGAGGSDESGDGDDLVGATMRCGRGRHTFLLADGGVQTLWERWHLDEPDSGGPGDANGRLFEIYECEEALLAAERRAHGGGSLPAQQSSGPEDDGRLPDPARTELARLLLEEATRSRPWCREDSPDHARRLLRRAENADRPGEETLRLLSGACGHDIVHVPRPRACPPGRHLWCSLYEHAFLLTDGTEISLYELEHNLTGGEGLVCEVYLDEAVADRAARRHARARGIDL
jgi:hypothetical protein